MSKNKLINSQENKLLLKISKIAKIVAFTFAFGLFTFGTSMEGNSSAASGGHLNVKVNYKTETAIITDDSNSNSRYYMSTNDMKSWEALDKLKTVDISTFLKSKDTTIYFKGNKDTNPVPVTLSGEDSSLKVLYQVVGETGKIVKGSSSTEVEYRVGSNGSWNDLSNSFETAPYEIKGVTMYFRTKATETKRAGKIIKLQIPKRPSPPSIKFDGSKLCITGLKSGQSQYRTIDGNWKTFESSDPKTNTLDLRLVFGMSSNGSIPAGSIEVRNAATGKKVASEVKTLEITAQPSVPDTISLNGSTLTIKDSDKKRQYEYTIVEKGVDIDITKAKWKSATTNKPILIRNVEISDSIYVRLKSSTVSSTKQVIPASTYKKFEVKSVSY